MGLPDEKPEETEVFEYLRIVSPNIVLDAHMGGYSCSHT